jgi:response regulator RpfG family c-di-GMP phosphodiesterase
VGRALLRCLSLIWGSFRNVPVLGFPPFSLSILTSLSGALELRFPFLGSKMLEGVPGMDTTRRAILEHHEHFDGSGYPYGLRGDDISLPARILSVAECYDSAVSARPHRGAFLPEEALQMVRGGSGTLFDPEVAQLFAAETPPH